MEERVGRNKRSARGKGKEDVKVNEEEEEISPHSFDRIPPEVVLKVLSQLDGKTLMVSVPQVCKRWRTLCQDIRNVHLDFRWWGGKFPAEVLAGWRQAPSTVGGGHAGGGGGGSAGSSSSTGGDGLKTGLCELFPRTTSVTMKVGHDVKDAHLIVLADKCRGIVYADFGGCWQLTDAAVLALADKCPGITQADFSGCGNLTDAAVIALADKCPGITQADFSGCGNLTDAAVIALADKCRGIVYVHFGGCKNLTDAAV
eukprot:gene24722-biopygen16423